VQGALRVVQDRIEDRTPGGARVVPDLRDAAEQ
jgi:hypothetical protein